MAYICKRCRNYNPISEICKVTGKKAITISSSEIQSRNYKCFDERIYKVVSTIGNVDNSMDNQIYGNELSRYDIKKTIDYIKFEASGRKNKKHERKKM